MDLNSTPRNGCSPRFAVLQILGKARNDGKQVSSFDTYLLTMQRVNDHLWPGLIGTILGRYRCTTLQVLLMMWSILPWCRILQC